MMKWWSIFFIFVIPLTAYATPMPVKGHQGMVVTEQRIATQVGVDILRQGGNAIDAAVAVGYALAVVYPCCGNIGGGGFMTIHLADGNNVVLNFREKAPLAATPLMFQNSQGEVVSALSLDGYRAVAVPGTVLGLDTALQRYGTMTREQVMQPAIRLAEEGFVVSVSDAVQFQEYAADFRAQPNIAQIFLKNGQAYQHGERLVQRQLAQTLRDIAREGPDVFYKGYIAQAIVKASQLNNGLLTLADFTNYQVEVVAPLTCPYKEYTLLTPPPPSGGGVALCEMLSIWSHLPQDFRLSNRTQALIETMRYAFLDRNSSLGDPAFINNPVTQLLTPAYAQTISQQILRTRFNPTSSFTIKKIPELTDTTHYSIADSKGNAVAVTYTINGFFGARVIAGNTGFFLNNEMNDFSIHAYTPNKFGLVQSSQNAIKPGKRPLSSMTPTIVLKNGRVVFVLGSPGGPRIISSVFLTLLHLIDDQMNIQQAVNAPRIHYQAQPDSIDIEPFALPLFSTYLLRWRGYDFMTQRGWGAVEAIEIDTDGTFVGANDIRRPDGAAIGY